MYTVRTLIIALSLPYHCLIIALSLLLSLLLSTLIIALSLPYQLLSFALLFHQNIALQTW